MCSIRSVQLAVVRRCNLDRRYLRLRAFSTAELAPAIATDAMYGFAEGGDSSVTAESSKDWLASAPRGAYTTARTVDRNKVLELSFHIERLAETARLMREDSQPRLNIPDALLSADGVRPLALKSLSAAVKSFEQQNPAHAGELRVTLLSHWERGEAVVAAHVGPLPGRPKPPVKVLIKGHPRMNAAAKDSEWIRERAALEAEMPADVNEIILASEDGLLLEGMTSNFMAIMDGKVYTAGEGILIGTIRDVLLQVCKANDIPVVLEPPSLADVKKWQGCMVSSTSRLALPVNHIEVASNGTAPALVHSFADDPLVSRLDQLVQDAIDAQSEPFRE